MVRTLADFIALAARQLTADGWEIARCRGSAEAAWHLAASKGAKWRVVQVLVPATAPARRLQDKIRLGEAAQLGARAGSMEQWLAHVRPGGHVTFGRDVLSGSAWGQNESEQQSRERLGVGTPREEQRDQPAHLSAALRPSVV
jgi:hypothetical protein